MVTSTRPDPSDQTLADRLGPERREQRTQHAAVLQAYRGRPRRGPTTRGASTKTRSPTLDAEGVEDVGESAGALGELTVRDVASVTGAIDAPQRHMVAAGPEGVPVDGLVGHVEPPAPGQAVEGPAGRGPGESGPLGGVVGHIGRGVTAPAPLLVDHLPLHGATPLPRLVMDRNPYAW